MERNHDEEMQEVIEEMAEDLEQTRPKEQGARLSKRMPVLTPHGQILVYGGIGAAILIIVLFFLFGRGKGASSKDLNVVKSRLSRLENQLVALEDAEKESSAVEDQIKGLERSFAKLDRAVRALREQLNKQSQKIDRIGKSSTQTTPAQKPESRTGKRYHEVRRGDTLFSIARKYGASVNDIRRLNNLSKNRAIYPGQKIMIP